PGSRQISVNGNGTDFQPGGPGSGPVSVTVPSGQTATFNLNMTSTGGYAGSVVLDCSGAPQSAACTVNPSTIQLTANGSVPYTVTVTTQKVVAAVTPSQIVVAGFGQLSFLSVIPLGLSRRLKNAMRVRAGAAICLLVFVTCLTVSGCGGGGGGGTKTTIQ